ncbi:MAG: hypothetical protein WKF65_16635 [Gaiellaceae bacterium]
METVGEHPVPAGPLAVRWLAYELPEFRAGVETVARVALQNAGSAHWRGAIKIAYHWLDPLGNPIVWDGSRTTFAETVDPGATVELTVRLRAPMPPGRYRLALDLVDDSRFWFAEVGSSPLELGADVIPRIPERRLAALIHAGPGEEADTRAALASLDEPLVAAEAVATAHLAAGCIPDPDWSRRILDAHAEGYAAVGGAVEADNGRRGRTKGAPNLDAWSSRGGRNTRFSSPLLFPSLVTGLEPESRDGMPIWTPKPMPKDDWPEPWVYDGRIRLRLRRDRRRA